MGVEISHDIADIAHRRRGLRASHAARADAGGQRNYVPSLDGVHRALGCDRRAVRPGQLVMIPAP